MYVCKHFIIEELVPPHVYAERGEKAWELFDDRALITLDALRDKFGSITVNNWKWGGNRKWSGLRTPESPYYSPYSQHTFGRAFDCIFNKINTEDARHKVLKDRAELFPYITGVELKVSWFHFDCRNHTPVKVFSA